MITKLIIITFDWVLVGKALRFCLPPDHQAEVGELVLPDFGVGERDVGLPDALNLLGRQLVLAQALTQILEPQPVKISVRIKCRISVTN